MREDLKNLEARERERDISLCRSLLYEALAIGFRPPTAETCSRLGTRSAAAALAQAAAILDRAQGSDLAGKTAALAEEFGDEGPDALTPAHPRLFGHTAKGPVPAYETEYGEDTLFQKPQEMSDIAGFLQAFGLVLDPAQHERVDHISCELEFMAFLTRKESHAIECGDETMRDQTRRAIRLFLKDHLGRFAPSFAHRVLREEPGGFYSKLASLCLEFVTTECDRFQIPAGPANLRLRLPLDDGAPMACGTGDCAPGACGPDPGNPK